MQTRITVVLASALAVAAVGLLGWQSWNTHQLQQQVVALQQQLASQSTLQSAAAPSNTAPLAPPPVTAAPLQQNSPLAPQGPSPVSPPSAIDPFWGGQDPFADMQKMQQEMHKHMQDLLSGLGIDESGVSPFDLDPFRRGFGFGSSMGFGDDPEFAFRENADSYQVTINIPKGSKVEINTSVKGRDLTVEGKVTVEQQKQNQGNRLQSLQTRQFARTFKLPGDVDVLGIRTESKSDQTVITLPKQGKRPQL